MKLMTKEIILISNRMDIQLKTNELLVSYFHRHAVSKWYWMCMGIFILGAE